MERWASVSTPVRKALQGLLEGFGRIPPSHRMLVVADGRAFNWASLFGCLGWGQGGPVLMRFSGRRRVAPAEALAATKDTASGDANSSSKENLNLSSRNGHQRSQTRA